MFDDTTETKIDEKRRKKRRSEFQVLSRIRFELPGNFHGLRFLLLFSDINKDSKNPKTAEKNAGKIAEATEKYIGNDPPLRFSAHSPRLRIKKNP